MPHLSQLQRDYKNKNVTIIGMTSLDENNSLEAVKKMVADKGDGIGYSIAWDVDRKTNEAWMAAAGQRGIPASFLVDQKGNIAWIGHPGNVDVPLAAVVAGKRDYVKGPEMMKAASRAKREIYTAAAKDPQKALALLEKFTADYPLHATNLDDLRFNILSRLPKQKAAAEKLGTKLVDKAIAAKSPSALNAFAWDLVDPGSDREERFLDLALRAATAASDLMEGKDGAILDTLARAHFWRGDLDKALKTQELAVEYSKGNMQAELKKVLAEYEQAIADKSNS